MTGADRRPFSLLGHYANQRSCSDNLITMPENRQSLQTPPSAISRAMSRGLRRTDRPIETAGIAPDMMRRLTVRADTLRTAAVSPTVRSGSRPEARLTATLRLLRDSRSLTTAES
jgi:hypothetical protein